MLTMRQVGGGVDDLSQGTGGCPGVDGGGNTVNSHIGGAVVGIDGAHQIDLGAGEVHGEACTCVAPLAGLVDGELGTGLIIPGPGEGEAAVPLVDDLHAVGRAGAQGEALGGLVDADLRQHGHGALGSGVGAGVGVGTGIGGDGDLHIPGLDGGGPDQALGTDGGALLHGGPAGRIIAVLDPEGGDPLTELDGLLNGDNIEGGGLAQIDQDGAGGGVVLHGPVGQRIAVKQVGGRIGDVIAADLRGRDDGPCGPVGGEGAGNGLAELSDPVQDQLIHRALVIGRNVQQHDGVVANGAEVTVGQIRHGGRGLLAVAPEPAGGDLGVCLGNGPLVAVGPALGIAGALGMVSVEGVAGLVHDHLRPGLLVGQAGLVADPVDGAVGLGTEEHGVGGIPGGPALVLLDGFKPSGEIVILGIGAAALCAVHPDLHKVAVVAVDGIAEDLLELGIVIVVVVDGVGGSISAGAARGVVAVGGIMDVPGGQIQAHIQVILGAGRGDLRQDVAAHAVIIVFAVAGLAGLVAGVGAVPDAEAVVVLGGHDQGAEAGLLQRPDQQLCVKVLLQLEDLVGSLAAVMLAPFDLIERIGAKVTERREPLLLIAILVRIRDHCVLSGGRGAIVRQGIHGHIDVRGISPCRKGPGGQGTHQCGGQHQCDPSFSCAHSFSSLSFSNVDGPHPQYGLVPLYQ